MQSPGTNLSSTGKVQQTRSGWHAKNNIMKKLFFILSVITVVFSACTHDPGVIIAGKGGSATVVVYPRHHGRTAILDSTKVYVKYNTLDAPANGIYDDSMVCANADTLYYATFTGLKNGNYYFYGTGYDNSISQRVKGGLPYTITQQTSFNFDLPVSEQ